MNKLISILASTVIAVSAMMTTSGTIKTSADADAFSAATEKTTYTIQDVRNLQGFILAIRATRSRYTTMRTHGTSPSLDISTISHRKN